MKSSHDERVGTSDDVSRIAVDGRLAGLWTSIPAIVVDFDPVSMTVTAQAAVQATRIMPTGASQPVSLPIFQAVPVQFPGGAGGVLTFPIAAGDEVLVIFASRSLDNWWSQGGVQPAMDFRRHDLSDGIAIPGLRSRPRVTTVNMAGPELRSDDGSIGILLSMASEAIIITAPGGVIVNAPVVNVLAGDVVATGKSLKTHIHSGVQTGSGTSGPPV